jgi:hypothetical protein
MPELLRYAQIFQLARFKYTFLELIHVRLG